MTAPVPLRAVTTLEGTWFGEGGWCLAHARAGRRTATASTRAGQRSTVSARLSRRAEFLFGQRRARVRRKNPPINHEVPLARRDETRHGSVLSGADEVQNLTSGVPVPLQQSRSSEEDGAHQTLSRRMDESNLSGDRFPILIFDEFGCVSFTEFAATRKQQNSNTTAPGRNGNVARTQMPHRFWGGRSHCVQRVNRCTTS